MEVCKMGMTEAVYWKIIQRDLGCDKCKKADVKMLYKGIPCDKWTEYEGTDECPYKEDK